MLSNTVDDEEEMLYGESSPLTSPAKEEPSNSTSAAVHSGKEGVHSPQQEPTHWCMIIRENGVMEVGI